MDNLIIGLIVILALAYLGTKIYKQVSGKVAAAVVAVAPKNLLVAVVTVAVMVPIKH